MIVALDSSVLIAFFRSGDEHHREAHRLLSELVDDDLLVSSMTLAEVLVGPARARAAPAFLDALDRLGIREEKLPENMAVRLAELRAETGLKLPDCCVLLAAETSGAAAVRTFDARLMHVAGQRGLN